MTALTTRLLIITTRNDEALVGLGAEEPCVDVLSSSDAPKLKTLAEWERHKNSDKLPAEAAEVAKAMRFLPLAPAIIEVR